MVADPLQIIIHPFIGLRPFCLTGGALPPNIVGRHIADQQSILISLLDNLLNVRRIQPHLACHLDIIRLGILIIDIVVDIVNRKRLVLQLDVSIKPRSRDIHIGSRHRNAAERVLIGLIALTLVAEQRAPQRRLQQKQRVRVSGAAKRNRVKHQNGRNDLLKPCFFSAVVKQPLCKPHAEHAHRNKTNRREQQEYDPHRGDVFMPPEAYLLLHFTQGCLLQLFSFIHARFLSNAFSGFDRCRSRYICRSTAPPTPSGRAHGASALKCRFLRRNQIRLHR